MNRMNYFNPYESKEAHHEDQLTRAYLVLLKYSSNAFFAFFEYCRKELNTEEEHSISILDYLENDWIIETQKSNPVIETKKLLSILITDNIKDDISVSSSDRNARYDGVITFSDKLTMIIENKPVSKNVWFDQLNPSKQNLAEDIFIYKKPAILEWKEIIKHLNYLLSFQNISGFEKNMINDFLIFVDENFSDLKPFDNFALCKNNDTLINRRIENFLKSIVCDPNMVSYHREWGYKIETPFNQIKEIGLIKSKSNTDENGWELELHLFFGDTQTQAISFYKSNPDIAKLKGCGLYNRFHVSFGQRTLAWFGKEGETIEHEKYIEYWTKNLNSIYRYKKENVENFLEKLHEQKVIFYGNEEKNLMKNKYFDTAMSTLNICPSFGAIFFMSSKDVMEKDNKDELRKFISDKIKEGLSIINLDWRKILKEI